VHQNAPRHFYIKKCVLIQKKYELLYTESSFFFIYADYLGVLLPQEVRYIITVTENT
jgi:hypothetical protein